MKRQSFDQRTHINRLLDKGFRYDKRNFEEYREIEIKYGVSKTAEGSAKVKIGNTEVIAGVKASIGEPFPDSPDQGNLSVNVELLPLSNPHFEPGPPGARAIELSRVIDRGIRESGALDFKELCIIEGEKVWNIMIDICTINDDGNLLDAASLAAIAALKDFRFPQVDDQYNIDYKTKTEKKLNLKDIPIEITVYKIGKNLLIDPTLDEEEAIDARLTVASLSDGTICALQKGEAGALSEEDMKNMIDIALKKAKELRELIQNGQ